MSKGTGRYIQTYHCGEVGMRGTRYVLDGGRIAIGGSRGAKHITTRRLYGSPLLLPHLGMIVYFADVDRLDGRIDVNTVTFEIGRLGRMRTIVGDFICYAAEEVRS